VRSNLAIDDQEWDRVWDEYDARQAARAPATPAPAPAAPARPRRLPWRSLALLAVMSLGMGWLAVPLLAARDVTAALAGRASDVPHLDMARVQAAVGQMLGETAAAAGARLSPPAGRFLDAMAAEMTQAWADPATLSAVARARGVTDPVPRLQPEGFSRLSLALGGTQPLTLHMELVEAGPLPRWQVAGVSLPLALPVVPPARLAMR